MEDNIDQLDYEFRLMKLRYKDLSEEDQAFVDKRPDIQKYYKETDETYLPYLKKKAKIL